MIGSPLIIDKSSTRPAWKRVLDWILSALMWLLYFYMIKEVLIDLYRITTGSLVWMFDRGNRPSLLEVSNLFQTLRIYGIVILGNSVILIVWALYNQVRFSGHDQPAAGSKVSVDDLATLYRLSAEDIAGWQGSRVLSMQHDADGTLVKVTANDVGQVGLRSLADPAAEFIETKQAAD